MRTVIALIGFFIPLSLFAQNYSIHGEILDEEAMAMPSATVVLLNPADSTLQYYGISNREGRFEIKGIKEGTYLMQVAFIGYNTIYNKLEIPYDENGNLGTLIMTPKPVSMGEVTVQGERIPLKIKSDTIEYDAKAFKVAPDGVVEDLIRKLPGIEVDRAGNIKALGEEVNNVLVDGKEFFGNDPKVATKNLPAGAVDKVQLYNKKSEEAEFTGIDDGSRNQTLNLVLNEDSKQGIFGEVLAGGGTGKHYQGNAKAYRFSDKTQFAALGMMNNINKYGFSVGDYLTFNGGLAAMGGGFKISLGGGGFPVNFGETINGYSTSGAAGLNYSYSRKPKQRFFISYLGSGTKRELEESSKTTAYRETGSYMQEEITEQVKRDTSHSVNFGTRYLFNESNNLIINGNISYNTAYNPLNSTINTYEEGILVNDMLRKNEDLSDRLSGNGNLTYLKMINEGSTILKFFGTGSYSSGNSETEFENTTNYYNPDINSYISQFRENTLKTSQLRAALSFTQKISKLSFLDIVLNANRSVQLLSRVQGDATNGHNVIDTLSPDFDRYENNLRPGISIRRNSDKSTFSIGFDLNMGEYYTVLNQGEESSKQYRALQPKISWDYEYGTGRRLSLSFNSSINTPSADQLLPVVNNFNSLSLFYGNRDLEPEYSHSLSSQWWIFDQFSFTTFMASLRVNYTENKISYDRQITEQFGQIITLANVESDLMAGASIDFSTPIRALGIKTNLYIDESYNKGFNLVNNLQNEVNSFNHRLSLSFENRKKEKWDISTGTGITLTDTRYSIQESLDNVYFDISWFGTIRWTPNDRFDFNINADVTNYTARSFEESRVVPLLGAQLSYFFMQNNRAALTLSAFDILNQNTGINRISELNYLRETRSNTIGRYFMLTFKYRLNKVGGDSGFVVDVKKR